MSNQPPRDNRESTFTGLYDAAYADLLRFAQRRVHPSQAEDVVAEAFLIAWRRLDDLPKDHDAARAWLFGIARGVMLNSRRSVQRQRALAVRLATVPNSVDHAPEDVVARQVDFARAWQRLSEVHQEALALAGLEGLSAPQAAKVLGISPVAFRLRLSRARRALRLHFHHLPANPISVVAAERTVS